MSQEDTSDQGALIELSIATCNVLTLKGKDDQLTGLSGVARQRMLMQQMKDEGHCSLWTSRDKAAEAAFSL